MVNNNINIIFNNSQYDTAKVRNWKSETNKKNYFLHYINFAGKLSNSASSRSLYNIYYTKKLLILIEIIDITINIYCIYNNNVVCLCYLL